MQKGFYLDLTRCTSCYACVVACKAHHAMEEEKVYWRSVHTVERGTHPDLRLANLSLSCMHCARPPCREVCPTRAIYKLREGGVVLVNPDYCIGCRVCLTVCPFGIPQFGKDGKMQKCDFCSDRIKKGLAPVCVSICPARALHTGSMEELSLLAARKSARQLIHGAEPSFFI